MHLNSLVVIVWMLAGAWALSINANDKIPLYLSIEASTIQAKPQTYDLIYESLQRLNQSYPYYSQISDDMHHIKEVFDTGHLSGNWTYPVSWHTTVLYIGNNMS